jgi:hypothetical protein
MQEHVQLTRVFSRSFSIQCASFSMLDGPGEMKTTTSSAENASIEVKDLHGNYKKIINKWQNSEITIR